MIQIIWEITVNMIESGLNIVLLQNRLTPKREVKPKLLYFWCPVILLMAITSFCNYQGISSHIVQIIIFFSLFFYSILTFQNSIMELFLWSFASCIMSIFADNVTFWIGAYLFPYQLTELLMGGSYRVFSTILYLGCTGCFVLLLLHLPRNSISFPKMYPILLLGFVLVAAVACNYLLDVIIYTADSLKSHAVMRKLNLVTVIVFLVLFLMLCVMIKLGEMYQRNQLLNEELYHEMMERKELDNLKTTTYVLRQWKHEIHTHMKVLGILNKQKRYGELTEYLKEMNQRQPEQTFMLSTGNVIVDSVVSAHMVRIREAGIKFSHTIYLPESIPVSDFELAGLLGNILDNAIEACLKFYNPADTFITFHMKPVKTMLLIEIKNSSDGYYVYKGKGFGTTKKEGNHGLGLPRVKQILERYEGFWQIEPKQDTFEISLMIPLNTK